MLIVSLYIAYIHIHTYTHIHTHTYAHTHAHTHTRTHTHMHTTTVHIPVQFYIPQLPISRQLVDYRLQKIGNSAFRPVVYIWPTVASCALNIATAMVGPLNFNEYYLVFISRSHCYCQSMNKYSSSDSSKRPVKCTEELVSFIENFTLYHIEIRLNAGSCDVHVNVHCANIASESTLAGSIT